MPELPICVSVGDRSVPPLTVVKGTPMARREVISSVGHPLGYAGFSGAARVCPQGRVKRALAAPEVPG